MTSLSTIVIFLAVAFVSLCLVSFINQRQMRGRLRSQKISTMKRRISELEDLSLAIESLVGSQGIATLVIDEIINVTENMEKLDPGSPYLEVNISSALKRKEDLRTRPSETFRLQESDAAIARAHYALNEVSRIVRKRHASGAIEVAQMDSFMQELTWSDLMVNVTSLVGHGHKAINRGDSLKAAAFYKKAQLIAKDNASKDERRTRLIKELSEILESTKTSLSKDLMPETLYNPIPTSEAIPPPSDSFRGAQ